MPWQAVDDDGLGDYPLYTNRPVPRVCSTSTNILCIAERPVYADGSAIAERFGLHRALPNLPRQADDRDDPHWHSIFGRVEDVHYNDHALDNL